MPMGPFLEVWLCRQGLPRCVDEVQPIDFGGGRSLVGSPGPSFEQEANSESLGSVFCVGCLVQ